MSSTLTWRVSSQRTLPAYTVSSSINEIVALFNENVSDDNFKWMVASSNDSTHPYYVVLKRKDGSAGRILFLLTTSSISGTSRNPSLFDANTGGTAVMTCFFPNSNVDTPSNLLTNSGSVMGDDTGTTKCVFSSSLTNFFTAGDKLFYFETDESVLLLVYKSDTSVYALLSGYIIEDVDQNVFPGVAGFNNNGFLGLTNNNNSNFSFNSVELSAGIGNQGCLFLHPLTNTSRELACAFQFTGWIRQDLGDRSILTDTSNLKAWFVPIMMISPIKGEGIKYKLRQIAAGPPSTGPLAVYNVSTEDGPVTKAINTTLTPGGSLNFPWLVNFKI